MGGIGTDFDWYRSGGCHPHFHLIVADGIFSSEDGLQFHEATLTQDDITDTQEAIQKRVLRYFYHQGFYNKDEMEKMLTHENSGFSLDATVKIPSFDKDALERLIRYCARPGIGKQAPQPTFPRKKVGWGACFSYSSRTIISFFKINRLEISQAD